jgi:hypothetical protein
MKKDHDPAGTIITGLRGGGYVIELTVENYKTGLKARFVSDIRKPSGKAMWNASVGQPYNPFMFGGSDAEEEGEQEAPKR